MYLPDVELHDAATLDEASELLVRHAPDARLLAGGTDVLVDLKTRRIDCAHLVSLAGVDGLRGLDDDGDDLRIGAMTSIAQLLRTLPVEHECAVLLEAARQMAAPQIRQAATVGGNIVSAVPCADLPPVLMVLNARLELWSPRGLHSVPLDEFFLGPRETALREDELLTCIVVPRPPARFGAAYERFALRAGNAIAVASVAVGVEFEPDGTVADARLALGAVAPVPKRIDTVNEQLVGRALDEKRIERAATAAMRAAEPISDIRGSAEFRRELIGTLTRRALLRARARVER